MRIYLDHNAGAPLRPEVRAAILNFREDAEGNPSAVHRSGQRARRALERARAQVAHLAGCAADEIVFTSGGTESNNLAIYGAVRALPGRRKIISSAIEHSSVLAPLEDLASAGFEVMLIEPGRDGRIAPGAVASALDANTALVTLGLANAETGAIQDIASMAGAIAAAGALFHLDAAQAVGRIPVRASETGCDLMTLSGHKLGAPGGIGALFVRCGVALVPTMLGGPQEKGLRAGTPNLAGAIALGAAAEAVESQFAGESARVAAMASWLLDRLCAAIPNLRLNGPEQDAHRIANTLNLTFPGVLGESMLIALDLEEVEVSMGSACAAGAVEPSHVLRAMGLGRDEARSSLRLSLGWSTSEAEIDRAAEIIPRVWRRVLAAEPAKPAEAATGPVEASR